MTGIDASAPGHGALMDAVYRRQRHVYDLTRKYYLLGRDEMLAGLRAAPGETMLELGCGTGRNIVLAARLYPQAHLFGLDISAAMLETASVSLAREGLCGKVRLAEGDATGFDGRALFGVAAFDRVFISYSLSMIPDWQGAVRAALAALAPSGSLHIVDFGQQERLPGWFRPVLRAWLRRFHVEPRAELRQVLATEAARDGRAVHFEPLYRDYARHAIIGPRLGAA